MTIKRERIETVEAMKYDFNELAFYWGQLMQRALKLSEVERLKILYVNGIPLVEQMTCYGITLKNINKFNFEYFWKVVEGRNGTQTKDN